MVDRIEEAETAVVLLVEAGDVIEQLDGPVDQLPEGAQTAGAVLSVPVADGAFVTAEYRSAESRDRRESIRE